MCDGIQRTIRWRKSRLNLEAMSAEPHRNSRSFKIDTKTVCTIIVFMRNITLSASEEMIEQARSLARQRKSTLNAMFREWLSELVDQRDADKKLQKLELRISYARSGGKFSREEMNAR